MPTLTILRNYADGFEFLNEEQLDDIKDSIETFLGVTKLGADNFQGTLGADKIALEAVDNVTLQVNNDKHIIIAPTSLTTAHLKTSGISGTKLADHSLLRAMEKPRVAGNATVGDIPFSSELVTFTTSSTSFVEVSDLNLSIVHGGRPIKYGVTSSANVSGRSFFEIAPTAGGLGSIEFRFLKDGVAFDTRMYGSEIPDASLPKYLLAPLAAFQTILTGLSPGTSSITMEVRCVNAASIELAYLKSFAYEN